MRDLEVLKAAPVTSNRDNTREVTLRSWFGRLEVGCTTHKGNFYVRAEPASMPEAIAAFDNLVASFA